MRKKRVVFQLPKKRFFHQMFSRVIYSPQKIYFVRSDNGFTLDHFANNIDIIEQHVNQEELLEVVDEANKAVEHFADVRYKKGLNLILALVLIIMLVFSIPM